VGPRSGRLRTGRSPAAIYRPHSAKCELLFTFVIRQSTNIGVSHPAFRFAFVTGMSELGCLGCGGSLFVAPSRG
jgi:hypothetical protein